jgi:hypothetical protein
MGESRADIVMTSRPEDNSGKWALGQDDLKRPRHPGQESLATNGDSCFVGNQDDLDGALEVAQLVARLVGGGGGGTRAARVWAEGAAAAAAAQGGA